MDAADAREKNKSFCCDEQSPHTDKKINCVSDICSGRRKELATILFFAGRLRALPAKLFKAYDWKQAVKLNFKAPSHFLITMSVG